MSQLRDDVIISNNYVEEVSSDRRKRSLKFRAKMRRIREIHYGDCFFKKDRSLKNVNKALAARRRRRDKTGKFDYQESEKESSEPDMKPEAERT